VTYQCPDPGDPGRPVIFTDVFPTGDGRARLVPAPLRTTLDPPDDAYPFVLITGRLLEHWHTGAMTRRATTLEALEPRAEIGIHIDDLARLGLADGAPLRMRSRQGELVAVARGDASLQPGQLFLPFCYVEAAANLLTSAALDPDAKIPGFKYTAVAAAPA
jgi:formate dehydrogenase major subunit